MTSPHKTVMQLSKWFSNLDWRVLLAFLAPLSLLIIVSFSSISSSSTSFPITFSNLPSFTPIGAIFSNQNVSQSPPPISPSKEREAKSKSELERSRIAVCLVGGARRFDLTGPSIVKQILKVYANSDLFLHSPLDSNAFKFSLLKISPRIATIRIFEPERINETESQLRVLTPSNSPNGIQGLLQYFNLVEGCLTMIKAHQAKNNFTYDWVVRTRVDGYWSAPLQPDNFVPGQYLVPPGSTYGGLNDRLGIGDLNTSTVALSRLSLITKLDSAGLRQLNSESAFQAQLTTLGVPFVTKRVPFCIVTDRKYSFPPSGYGVPVAALSSKGPLSGAKCRPCRAVCSGECVGGVMSRLYKGWSWTDWANGSLALCDAHGKWEKGWEAEFDRVAGKKLAAARRRMAVLNLKQCVDDFEEMKRKTGSWEAPDPREICRLGLGSE
ncbi:hypothetical protein NMG60_11016017 [Bertholletia excelsa]